jgi:[ribosomal protein S18]-alanine N-acetyltransferase
MMAWPRHREASVRTRRRFVRYWLADTEEVTESRPGNGRGWPPAGPPEWFGGSSNTPTTVYPVAGRYQSRQHGVVSGALPKAPVVVRTLTAEDASIIVASHYPRRWSVYDVADPAIFSEANGYHAIAESVSGRLIGFVCTGAQARVRGMVEEPKVLDVGDGLDPSLVGRGHGGTLLAPVLDWARLCFPGFKFRAVVQEWNERSLRLCRSLGFKVVGHQSSKKDGPSSMRSSWHGRCRLRSEDVGGRRPNASCWPLYLGPVEVPGTNRARREPVLDVDRWELSATTFWQLDALFGDQHYVERPHLDGRAVNASFATLRAVVENLSTRPTRQRPSTALPTGTNAGLIKRSRCFSRLGPASTRFGRLRCGACTR